MVPNTQLTQECPKPPIEPETLGDVAKASFCGAPHPIGWSGRHTGGKVAVWTGVGSIELRRIITVVPTGSYKDKLPLCIAGNSGVN